MSKTQSRVSHKKSPGKFANKKVFDMILANSVVDKDNVPV